MSEYQNNSIFWVETEKISANPFQPRREFDQDALETLADSIRQYGVLQPLVVTRKEEETESGGYYVYYELIAGERRLRAARLAGLNQVPVIIRKQTDNKVRLELAIIENLQREDLNPIDRALAFEQLHKEFNLTHAEIGKRMGKSRVYVSNSLRLLSLPQDIREGLISGKITEGHTRPLLMLTDKPEEQTTLFKEIILKKMSVRDSEKIARKIAQDRVRKKEFLVDPRIRDYEVKLSENLGTRVQIEPKEHGGKITIDYFTVKDLEKILSSLQHDEQTKREKQEDESSSSKETDFDFFSGKVTLVGNQALKKENVQGNLAQETPLEVSEFEKSVHAETGGNVSQREEQGESFVQNIVEEQKIPNLPTEPVYKEQEAIMQERRDINAEKVEQEPLVQEDFSTHLESSEPLDLPKYTEETQAPSFVQEIPSQNEAFVEQELPVEKAPSYEVEGTQTYQKQNIFEQNPQGYQESANHHQAEIPYQAGGQQEASYQVQEQAYQQNYRQQGGYQTYPQGAAISPQQGEQKKQGFFSRLFG